MNGGVLASYLSAYGDVEDVLARSVAGTAHSDYVINMCRKQEGFQAIPHISKFEQQNMMVVVEDRKLLCLSCKQLGHFARSYSQKTKTPTIVTTTAAITTTTIKIEATPETSKESEPGDHSNKEEGWT